jgi:hypothetical protein
MNMDLFDYAAMLFSWILGVVFGVVITSEYFKYLKNEKVQKKNNPAPALTDDKDLDDIADKTDQPG